MSLVEISDYHLVFNGFEGRNQVLDGIDLTIAAGESVGLVGETGCGKSVLAKSLLKLIDMPPGEVTGGSIRFDGVDVLNADRATLARLRGTGIAMIFQDPATFLNPLFTIGAQLGDVIVARTRAAGETRHSRADETAIAFRLLDQVGLPASGELLGRFPHELSGGMRQRVLIAMALAGQPRLLVADEPTTALDVTVQVQILELIADLVAKSGMTLLLVSHDLGVIGALCQRIIVMYAGVIVEDAPAVRIFDAPLHPYTRGLIAATPDVAHPERRPAGIAGHIPDLVTPPPGCRFHPRCALAVERCRVEKPAMRQIDGSRVACHLAGEPA